MATPLPDTASTTKKTIGFQLPVVPGPLVRTPSLWADRRRQRTLRNGGAGHAAGGWDLASQTAQTAPLSLSAFTRSCIWVHAESFFFSLSELPSQNIVPRCSDVSFGPSSHLTLPCSALRCVALPCLASLCLISSCRTFASALTSPSSQSFRVFDSSILPIFSITSTSSTPSTL